MKYDVVSLGEYLIDFIPNGISPAGNPLYEPNPGGAPVNVVTALAKLGKKTAFIGMIGSDPFGMLLRRELLEHGVSDQGLVMTSQAHTTMAFVHLDKDGERFFHFCRHPGADQQLSFEEVDLTLLTQASIFHFGSISMTTDPAYTATVKSVQHAKKSGALISFDPNWRPSLWRDDVHAKQAILEGIVLADVVKISLEELAFLTGTENVAAGCKQLMAQFPVELLLVTLGSEGTFYCKAGFMGKVSGYQVKTLDTTGAGDGFLGAFLFQITEKAKPIQEWSEDELRVAVSFANAAGALATTRKGAIPALASFEDITILLNSHG
jgi:fructokinase